MKKLQGTVKKLLPLLFLIAGCTPPRLITQWKANDFNSLGGKKILVLALLPREQFQAEAKLEKQLVTQLNAIGCNATASKKVYASDVADVDEQTAIEKLQGSGFDAVLTVTLTGKSSERKYLPDNIYYPPYGDYYNRFDIYRNDLFNQVYKPGYYIIDTDFAWKTDLFDLKSKKLLCSIQIQSATDLNTEKLAAGYAVIVVSSLQPNPR
ncbi:hypothetical protein [Mucilaginibacter flavidus]|uniref:hypothetical protein n=1 Tax=Mucilaginibacter flavidus TaxID=2949309 RepID=UPI002092CF08|nr:hypothetical protein [Mucilaginibacter flavidus]MCO5946600.1 hypothetical protein [Mucilaginibacter flavidus]